MSIYLGNTEIGQIYLGNTEISEAYLGGTKVFEKGGGGLLPTGFEAYDWVQADSTTGKPAIDTGYYMNAPQNTKQHRYTIEGSFAKCENFAASSSHRIVFSNTTLSTNGAFCIKGRNNSTTEINYVYNNRYGNLATCSATISYGIWHTFTLTHKDDESFGGKLVLDGNTYTYTSDTNNATNTKMYLLGISDQSGRLVFPCRLARLKIYDNGELACDLVPAKRLSDDVVGFYDVVRDVFCVSTTEGVNPIAGNGLENFNT